MSKDKPSVSDQDLSDLIKDLEGRQSYLEQTVAHLAHLAESVDADFKGPAAAAHKKLQRDAYKDAARIRQLLLHIEEATKQRGESLSQPYLDLLHRFQSLQRSPERREAERNGAERNGAEPHGAEPPAP